MALWFFTDDRQSRVFRACSLVVAVGALMGAAAANTWVDPAGEWADGIRYMVVLAFVLAAWVVANWWHRRLMEQDGRADV